MNVNPNDIALVISCPVESNNNKVVVVGQAIIPPCGKIVFFDGRPFVNVDWSWEVDVEIVCVNQDGSIIGTTNFIADKYLIPLNRKGFESDERYKVVYEEHVL